MQIQSWDIITKDDPADAGAVILAVTDDPEAGC